MTGKNQTFPFLKALEHSHVPSAVLLPDTGELTWLNPAAKAIVGDVRGKRWVDCGALTPEGIEASTEAWHATVAGEGAVHYDTVIKTTDGTPVPVSASSVLIEAGGVPVVFRQFYPKAGDSEVSRVLKRKLTDRQLDILRLIAQGHSSEEIAKELVLSVSTIRTHAQRILGILKVQSRTAAVAIAYQEGLL